MPVELDAIADELYGLRPEDFVAARDARAAEARKAGDRALADAVRALRRPGLSAWASNLLVREHPDEIEPLLRLGETLRQAHRALDGARLRESSRRQRVLVGELARQAQQLAARTGHPVGEDVRREVEDILHAVLADAQAAEEWRTGRLVRPFGQVVGFPAVGEAAVPRPPARPAAATRHRVGDDSDGAAEERRPLAEARKEAKAAERELRALEGEAATAARAADEAGARADRLRHRVAELTAELKSRKDEERQARAVERRAWEEARAADRGLRYARRRAEDATARVAQLGGGGRGSTGAKRRRT
ncbi:hypothetical protein [Streptomyces sp. 142MFCol3.1]|uniref:hypothetical protein n=1 Tax=Streptomyces sp. 142MFCol3.1 TaxID=1172179 RepID=UPI0004020691|nr:hypothetical protein [Streptomyces sp. 142MFCol3.1]